MRNMSSDFVLSERLIYWLHCTKLRLRAAPVAIGVKALNLPYLAKPIPCLRLSSLYC